MIQVTFKEFITGVINEDVAQLDKQLNDLSIQISSIDKQLQPFQTKRQTLQQRYNLLMKQKQQQSGAQQPTAPQPNVQQPMK